ncbi:MAG: peptidoglycan DD-metalloendopeptidase family protein [Pseudomonadota bacterium]
MLKQLLSTMRQGGTLGGESSPASPRSSYLDMFDGQIAMAMAQSGGVGIARMLDHQWEQQPVTPATTQLAHVSQVVAGAHQSSSFGPRRDPLTGVRSFHAGVDLAAPEGSAVHPLGPGAVQWIGHSPDYGLNVVVDHGAGRLSRYAHLSATHAQVGQTVQVGDCIGEVGNTGRSTGPHVHVELRVRGEPVDPLRAALPGATSLATHRD